MASEQKHLRSRLGARLRALRVERRLTQQQLAERCRLSVNYVSEVERGLRNLSLGTLSRLAHAGLGTSLTILLRDVDSPASVAAEAPATYVSPRFRKLGEALERCSPEERARMRGLLETFLNLLS